jgi:sulfate transport system ATP-binding protein
MVERLVHLGFEVRVELVRSDGEQLSVQISRDQANLLELERGQIVYIRPLHERTFAED